MASDHAQLADPHPGSPDARDDGDPRCVRLDATFAQMDPSMLGATSRASIVPKVPRARSPDSASPPRRGVLDASCRESRSHLISAGLALTACGQFLLQYRSPVLPTLLRPIQAYLMLPPGYSPSGGYPAVVVTHGHHDTDKESLARCPGDSDHANALVLAEHGAITLAPDTDHLRRLRHARGRHPALPLRRRTAPPSGVRPAHRNADAAIRRTTWSGCRRLRPCQASIKAASTRPA